MLLPPAHPSILSFTHAHTRIRTRRGRGREDRAPWDTSRTLSDGYKQRNAAPSVNLTLFCSGYVSWQTEHPAHLWCQMDFKNLQSAVSEQSGAIFPSQTRLMPAACHNLSFFCTNRYRKTIREPSQSGKQQIIYQEKKDQRAENNREQKKGLLLAGMEMFNLLLNFERIWTNKQPTEERDINTEMRILLLRFAAPWFGCKVRNRMFQVNHILAYLQGFIQKHRSSIRQTWFKRNIFQSLNKHLFAIFSPMTTVMIEISVF